jgi:hypothetical protein
LRVKFEKLQLSLKENLINFEAPMPSSGGNIVNWNRELVEKFSKNETNLDLIKLKIKSKDLYQTLS